MSDSHAVPSGADIDSRFLEILSRMREAKDFSGLKKISPTNRSVIGRVLDIIKSDRGLVDEPTIGHVNILAVSPDANIAISTIQKDGARYLGQLPPVESYVAYSNVFRAIARQSADIGVRAQAYRMGEEVLLSSLIAFRNDPKVLFGLYDLYRDWEQSGIHIPNLAGSGAILGVLQKVARREQPISVRGERPVADRVREIEATRKEDEMRRANQPATAETGKGMELVGGQFVPVDRHVSGTARSEERQPHGNSAPKRGVKALERARLRGIVPLPGQWN